MKEILKHSSQEGKTLTGSLTLDVDPQLQIKVETDVVKLNFKQHDLQQITLTYQLELEDSSEYEEENEPVGQYHYDEGNNIFTYKIYSDDNLERSKKQSCEITVPVNSTIHASSEVSSIELSNIEAKVDLINENGPIYVIKSEIEGKISVENGPADLKQSKTDIEIVSENGPVTLKMCEGKTISIKSENGPVKMNDVCYQYIDVNTENGPVVCEILDILEGQVNIKTENGPIKVIIPENLPFNLTAKTENGPIRTKQSSSTGGTNSVVLTNSDSKVFFDLESENAPISILHDNQLIIKAIEKELNKTSEYIRRVATEFNPEDFKEKMQETVRKIKIMAEHTIDKGKNDFSENFEKFYTKLDKENIDKLKETVMEKKDELLSTIKTSIDKLKDVEIKFESKEKSKKKSVNEENKELSRLKILEILEKGIISAEEAERLLKALDS
jgi:hypothetical protein